MIKVFHWVSIPKLARQLLTSTLLLLAITSAGARAHEIRPAIANLTVAPDRADIAILLTLEAMLSGIDLQGLTDTNDSPLAGTYDQLRALSSEELRERFDQGWAELSNDIRLMAGPQRLPLTVESIEIDPVGDIELPRETILHLSSALPPDESAVTFGWAAKFGPLVVRQELPEGGGYSGYLTNGADSAPIPRTGSGQTAWLVEFATYVKLGFEHILPKGLDHILFVLGLFFFALKLRPILTQVTAFTLAHTVTLALAALGIVTVPAAVVEPLIAASIVYVAVENIFQTQYRPWRTAVVFGFGLLHGLGFASVLGEIGLDPRRFITDLIGFNIGVELGQLAVITTAFLTVGYWFGRKPWYRARISVPASVAIAIVGAYWFVERVFL